MLFPLNQVHDRAGIHEEVLLWMEVGRAYATVDISLACVVDLWRVPGREGAVRDSGGPGVARKADKRRGGRSCPGLAIGIGSTP